METGVVAALAAAGGAIVTKALDVALQWRRGSRDWYATELASLRTELDRQDTRIEHLEGKIDEQRALIRQHEDTISLLTRENLGLRSRLEGVEARDGGGIPREGC